MPVLSIVIPAYNEGAFIGTLIERILAVPVEELGFQKELIVVDDGSLDNTGEVARGWAGRSPQVHCFTQVPNQGKGKAVQRGIRESTGDYILVQDADLEYDPSEIPGVIEPILAGHADIVYGSRFLVRKAARVLYFYHYVANRGLTFLSNIFTNINLTDVETGYKAFRGEIIRNMIFSSSGFGFEIEVTAKSAKLKCAIYEVPISYHGRTYEEGKKIGFTDGIAALWYILRFNLFVGLEASYRTVPDCGARNRLHAQTCAADDKNN